jgi:tetratricopeptide (TPR) repeat protein
LLCLAAPRPAAAHVALDDQIAALTSRIGADRRNASLYLRRAELRRARSEWPAAEADYRAARRLDPGLAAADLGLGRMLLDAGRPGPARAVLDRFLVRIPGNLEGLRARGEALARLGRPLEAARDFTRAIAAARPPRLPAPEDYLRRAQALAGAGAGHLDEAIRGLDEGIAALGPIVTLELLAVDLETRLGRHEAALGRIERAASVSPRQEVWLLRRGGILERGGRRDEARRAYGDALAAIATLPAARRDTEAVRRIERDARAGLDRLAGRPAGAP